MPSTLLLVLALLGTTPSVHGGVTTETISGTYVPYPVGQKVGREKCPIVVKIHKLEQNSSSALSTLDRGCDKIRMTLKEAIRNEAPRGANGTRPRDSFTGVLLRNDFEKTGVIVTGNPITRLRCDRVHNRNRIPKRGLLNFFRPREVMKEWETEFKARDFYMAFSKGQGRHRCIYMRQSTQILPDAVAPPPAPAPDAVKPPTSANATISEVPKTSASSANGEPGISLWAWLGPLIGAAVLLIALLTAFCVHTRRDRWYPFAGQHEDISDAEFFGRISQQVDKHHGAERAPSGVVFERTNTSEHDRPSSGEYAPHRGEYTPHLGKP